jgi:ATP-dependent protease Clp ATPase subunit
VVSTAESPPPLICSFNGVSSLEVAKMFGATGAAICDNCLACFVQVLLDGAAGRKPGAQCAFCEQIATVETALIAGPRVYICEECVWRLARSEAPDGAGSHGKVTS